MRIWVDHKFMNTHISIESTIIIYVYTYIYIYPSKNTQPDIQTSFSSRRLLFTTQLYHVVPHRPSESTTSDSGLCHGHCSIRASEPLWCRISGMGLAGPGRMGLAVGRFGQGYGQAPVSLGQFPLCVHQAEFDLIYLIFMMIYLWYTYDILMT
jgi:hypothetical protein